MPTINIATIGATGGIVGGGGGGGGGRGQGDHVKFQKICLYISNCQNIYNFASNTFFTFWMYIFSFFIGDGNNALTCLLK